MQLKGKKTSKRLADLKEKRSTLIQQLTIWRPIQITYAPHVPTLLPLVQGDAGGEANVNHYSNPESTPLYFPSSLPLNIRKHPELKKVHEPLNIHEHPELKEVDEAECCLHEPQANNALADIHRL